MKRKVIDPDLFREKLEQRKLSTGKLIQVAYCMDEATVEVPDVVRCRDCKHYNTAGCSDGFGWCERNGNGHGSTDDWFCADGERDGCGKDACE